MNNLQVFQNSEFGELGIITIDGKEYFPATQCAKTLGYAKPHNAIKQHCRYSLKQGVPHPQNPSKAIEVNFIPEGDLYRLITHSKLPAAERFERWVFDEVLPSIRKTGGYNADDCLPLGKVMEIVQLTATTIITEFAKQIAPILMDAMDNRQTESAPRHTDYTDHAEDINKIYNNQCKLAKFPSHLRKQVDRMFSEMIDEQTLNFSQIVRFCALNGFSVSAPSVKRYYVRHFSG